MSMELPSEQDFDQGILDILENDVNGESLHHLTVIAMQIVLDGLKSVVHDKQITDVREIRRLLTGELIDSFADDTEFTIGKEIEIGDSAFYLLQDVLTSYFVVQRLSPDQKLIGSVETILAIDTASLADVETKVGAVVQLGGDAMPDAPAILLEDLRFITPEGKSFAFKPQHRALVPLNLPHAHPRVAVPQEKNAAINI